MILLLTILISLAGCKTIPVEPTVYIPNFTTQKPVRPVLEAVELVGPVPPTLLRNYSAVTQYALAWEWYYDEHEKFIVEQREIYTN